MDPFKEVIERRGFQLIPIWGRRRIGKTALLLHSLEKKALYFLATESTSIGNLKRSDFSEEDSRSIALSGWMRTRYYTGTLMTSPTYHGTPDDQDIISNL
ncbi:MAG: ATP-binding protein [Thermoplasmata archaeon]|nr:ATP-binding protein [Thermoplasmata archaeon]